jgi:hypothetical protein
MADKSNLGAVRFFPNGVDISKLPESVKQSLPDAAVKALQAVAAPPQNKKLNNTQSVPAMQTMPRWRSPQRPDDGCLARTKSEARAFFKSLFNGKLPAGFSLEKY